MTLETMKWFLSLAKCGSAPPIGVVPREPNGDVFDMDEKGWCGWILDTEANGAEREIENFELDPKGKMIFGCGVCPPFP